MRSERLSCMMSSNSRAVKISAIVPAILGGCKEPDWILEGCRMKVGLQYIVSSQGVLGGDTNLSSLQQCTHAMFY